MHPERPTLPWRRSIPIVMSLTIVLWVAVVGATWTALGHIHLQTAAAAGVAIGAVASALLAGMAIADHVQAGRRRTAAQPQEMDSRICAIESSVTELTKRVNRRADADYVTGTMAALDRVGGWPPNVHRLH